MKRIRMPKALAEKWLADLRSGEYKQCQGKLYNGEGYCCLGVLIKSAGAKVTRKTASGTSDQLQLPWIEWLEKNNITFYGAYDPKIKRSSPYITAAREYLDCLNDDGIPFSQIADLLETEIEYNDK